MRRQTDRDRAVGTAYWTHSGDFYRAAAGRRESQQVGDMALQMPYSRASFADLQLGDIDGAARMWLAGCRATRAELDAHPPGALRERAGRLTAWPLLAGDEDLLARVLHIAPPLREVTREQDPYSALLPALVLDDEPLIRQMAAAYDDRVTPTGRRPLQALPHLGAIALAVLDADADAATVHMTATLDAEVAARTRGYMRNRRALSFYAAGLWAAARRRGVDIDIPDRFHTVSLKFAVGDHIDLDGEDIYRERFTWPTDLLPTHMFDRAAQLRADDT